MGGGAQELTGPDLSKGVAFADLKENEPLLGHANGEAVVVVRTSATEVCAIGASCTHYGGPLAEGIVVDGTIRCPWHHARFDLKTGQAVGGPALNNAPCYEVAVSHELVQVRSKREVAKKKPAHSPSSVVLVGAGAASAACAEMLRKEGYEGPITMIGAEDPGPVDRPNLSKDYLAGKAPEEWIPVGDAAHWKELNVELLANDPATAIDTTKKSVTTKSGKAFTYDALLYATGAEPSRLPIDGATQAHVFTLRSLSDSRGIVAKVSGAKSGAKTVVIIGASFIGLEVAASLRERAIEVHVVGPDKTPLSRVLGDEVGAFIRKVHEDKGVKFHLETKPLKITATHVELDKGDPIPCDLVVMGVGVKPRVDVAKAARLALANADNGVKVDASLLTSAAGVWAAGDVANHEGTRIEHWVLAQRHGEHVAREMLRSPSEKPRAFKEAPFFWSAHFDKAIHYHGHISGAPAQTVVHGSLDNKGNAAIAYKDASGITRAVATLDRDRVSLEVEAAMERGDHKEVDRLLGA